MSEPEYDRVEIEARAEQLADETSLGDQQALVQAWSETDATRGKIADELGRAVSTIDDHRREIKRKRREARRTVAHLEDADVDETVLTTGEKFTVELASGGSVTVRADGGASDDE